VANEEMKIERFERGLKSKLKTNMAALTFPISKQENDPSNLTAP